MKKAKKTKQRPKRMTIYAWTKGSARGRAFQTKTTDLGYELLVQGPALAGVGLIEENPTPAAPHDKGVSGAGLAAGKKGDLVLWWASCPEAEAQAFATRAHKLEDGLDADGLDFVREQIGKLQRHVERELAKNAKAQREAMECKLEKERFLKSL